MKFMIWFMLLFPSLVFSQIVIGNHGSVGNNGEGIKQAEQIYLRDLYEAGLHLNAYIGSQILPEIQEVSWMLSSVGGLDVEKDLLLKKLSDAERLRPGFGIFLVKTIFRHSWSYIPDLLLSPTDEIQLPEGAELVPLAKRFKNVVRVHHDNFIKMSSENRAALILHEAIFSLVKIEGTLCEISVCVQRSHFAREITALLFRTPDGQGLPENLAASLDIAWPSKPTSQQVSLAMYNGSDLITQSVFQDDFRVSIINLEAFRFTQTFCSKIGSGSVRLEMTRWPFIVQGVPYLAKVLPGLDPQQMGTKIISRSGSCQQLLRFRNSSECLLEMRQITSKWVESLSESLYPGSCYTRK